MIPNIKYKTEFCRFWQEGKLCEKGLGCFFAHGQHELRSCQQNQQDILNRNIPSNSSSQPHNYKTIFCKFYAQGQCKLGSQCTYAHQRRQRRKKQSVQQPQVEAQQFTQYWTQQQYEQYYSHYYPQMVANYWASVPSYSLYSNTNLEGQAVVSSNSSPETDKSQNAIKQLKNQITEYEPEQNQKNASFLQAKGTSSSPNNDLNEQRQDHL